MTLRCSCFRPTAYCQTSCHGEASGEPFQWLHAFLPGGGSRALVALERAPLTSASACRFAARGGASGGPFTPQQEQQLEEALTEAVLAGDGTGNSSIREGAEAAAAGATAACAASPPWLLEQLASRAAAARTGAAAGEGGSSSEAEAELRGLRLEARDAVQALPARMRELSGLRRSLLKAQQGQQLGRLAALGEDGAPRATPLLRQLVGELTWLFDFYRLQLCHPPACLCPLLGCGDGCLLRPTEL